MARNLGWDFGVDLHSDVIAALGIARRRGVCKIKHLDTTDLWIQDQVRMGTINLHKVHGADNPADLFTKYLARPLIQKNMDRLGLVKQEGRAEAAPQLVTPIMLPRRNA